MNRVIITGGPGTGKTSLINELKKNGYNCSDEIVRKITLRKRKEGFNQYFLSNPLEFSINLFNKRLEEYKKQYRTKSVIYDRGPIDVLAYLEFKSIKVPKDLLLKSNIIKYKYSFILDPWHEIYQNDDIRYETYEECKEIHLYLKKKYNDFGIKLISVPKESVNERYKFVKSIID